MLNYWKDFFSTKDLFATKTMVIIGLMIAVNVVFKAFEVHVTADFKANSITYLPCVLVAILYGPWAAMLMGGLGDIVAHFIIPRGAYFPGFTLSAMLVGLIFALFLYKQEVTLPRAILSRFVVVLIVHLGLNPIWLNMLMGLTAAGYYTWARAIAYLIQFPFDIALIMLIGRIAQKQSHIL